MSNKTPPSETAISEQNKPTGTNTHVLIMRAPEDLKPSDNNPRVHSVKQIAKIKASIRKFDFTAPVLVDEDNVILAGHGRVLAATELGLAMIPVRVISGLTKAQKRAYVIADNKIAQESAWDKNLLKGELEILTNEDFDVETTGFSTAEIDTFCARNPIRVSVRDDGVRVRPRISLRPSMVSVLFRVLKVSTQLLAVPVGKLCAIQRHLSPGLAVVAPAFCA